MRAKFESLLNTGKKKAFAIAACGALTLTIGSGAIYASNGNDLHDILVKAGKDSISYSTDNGKSWTDNAPEGAVVTKNADGGTTISVGTPPAAGSELHRLSVRQNADGATEYSTDGGKTWSDKLPAGFESSVAPDGATRITASAQGKLPGGPSSTGEAQASVIVKSDKDVVSYSSDGGSTWTEDLSKLPEGVTVTTTAEGVILEQKDTPTAAGNELSNIQVRVTEGGVPEYSTDGGKTWSNKAPAGGAVFIAPEGSTSINMK